MSSHGDNGQEFSLMVKAGMSPIEAIQAATINAAALLGQSTHLGSIEVGKYADLIVVDENPLENIKILEDVQVVIKAGKVEVMK